MRMMAAGFKESGAGMERKFRFDSFASEFGCKSSSDEQEDVPDNDSGIGELQTQNKSNQTNEL